MMWVVVVLVVVVMVEAPEVSNVSAVVFSIFLNQTAKQPNVYIPRALPLFVLLRQLPGVGRLVLRKRVPLNNDS